ncbi:hypothetical protein J6590_029761 [Homalodisca vitripennis]|nr:hypothetical protein J6590_029761 [Homalodisca vitripennis]
MSRAREREREREKERGLDKCTQLVAAAGLTVSQVQLTHVVIYKVITACAICRPYTDVIRANCAQYTAPCAHVSSLIYHLATALGVLTVRNCYEILQVLGDSSLETNKTLEEDSSSFSVINQLGTKVITAQTVYREQENTALVPITGPRQCPGPTFVKITSPNFAP